MFDKGNITKKEKQKKKKNLSNEELLEKFKFPAKDIFVSLRG